MTAALPDLTPAHGVLVLAWLAAIAGWLWWRLTLWLARRWVRRRERRRESI